MSAMSVITAFMCPTADTSFHTFNCLNKKKNTGWRLPVFSQTSLHGILLTLTLTSHKGLVSSCFCNTNISSLYVTDHSVLVSVVYFFSQPHTWNIILSMPEMVLLYWLTYVIPAQNPGDYIPGVCSHIHWLFHTRCSWLLTYNGSQNRLYFLLSAASLGQRSVSQSTQKIAAITSVTTQDMMFLFLVP